MQGVGAMMGFWELFWIYFHILVFVAICVCLYVAKQVGHPDNDPLRNDTLDT